MSTRRAVLASAALAPLVVPAFATAQEATGEQEAIQRALSVARSPRRGQ